MPNRSELREPRWRVAGALLAGLTLGSVVGARADCLTPEPLLLWSYPAEGERGVPVDAHFWLLSSQSAWGARPTATLNGKALAAPALLTGAPIQAPNLELDPGPLAPDTAYTLALSYPALGDKPASNFELHFGTGSANSSAGESARVLEYATLAPPSTPREVCVELISAQGCFDTIEPEPPAVHRLTLQPSASIAWFVATDQPDGSMLWPARCGAPRVLLRAVKSDQCFVLTPIGAGGHAGPETRYCLKGGKAPKGPRKASAISASAPENVRGLAPLKPLAPPAPLAAAAPTPAAPAPSAAPPAAKNDSSCGLVVAHERRPFSAASLLLALAASGLCVRSNKRRRASAR